MVMKFNSIPKERCMVIQMNKTAFINELSKKILYSKEDCLLINNILEDNFFIASKNKDKIIQDFTQTLNIDNEEATKIYDIAIQIIKDQIKNKLKHPFKNQD